VTLPIADYWLEAAAAAAGNVAAQLFNALKHLGRKNVVGSTTTHPLATRHSLAERKRSITAKIYHSSTGPLGMCSQFQKRAHCELNNSFFYLRCRPPQIA
jgi:hypothetical protein